MGWLLLLLALAVVALPFVIEARRPLPPEPGESHHLPEGRVAVDRTGPRRGAPVVCVHGLTTPKIAFDGIARGLAESGYRVLTYDLWGRGGSDRVPGRQDAALFARQLDGLLEAEGLAENVTLIGYSMGGAIAAAYAAERPDRIGRVILLASAGLVPIGGGLSVRLARLPLLGDWLIRLVEPIRFRAEIRAGDAPPDIAAAQLDETYRRGFFPAVLSSLRHMLGGTQEAAHRRLAASGLPVVAIWGREDRVIPLSASGQLAQWNRQAKQEVVAGAGHGLPYTHPAEVVEIVKAILREG